MKKVIDRIFTSMQESLEKNLAAGKTGAPGNKSMVKATDASGTLPFAFTLDANGQYIYSTEQYGAGVTLECSATIQAPDATYNITITSSDGGGGTWNNVSPNQPINFTIETSFWHKTTIMVDIQASVANQSGNGQINYNY